MIELYTHPMSPCAQKVRIVLSEKSLPWEGRHVDPPGKENLEPWYLQLNKLGVVPTLVEDGYPRVTAWCARMRARPSQREAVADGFRPKRLAKPRVKDEEGLGKIRRHLAAAAGRALRQGPPNCPRGHPEP